MIHDHRHAAALEIKRDFVNLTATAFDVEIRAIKDRAVEQITETRLVVRIHPSVTQDVFGIATDDVDVALEDDVILGERAGLIGTEDIHRPKVLDGVEALHHNLEAGQRTRAFGKTGRENHREHLGREADGDR